MYFFDDILESSWTPSMFLVLFLLASYYEEGKTSWFHGLNPSLLAIESKYSKECSYFLNKWLEVIIEYKFL